MMCRFNCTCKLKICRTDNYVLGRVSRKVKKFREQLTAEPLQTVQTGAIDNSFWHLSRLVEQRWLPILLEEHNDPDVEFHFDQFEVIIIREFIMQQMILFT